MFLPLARATGSVSFHLRQFASFLRHSGELAETPGMGHYRKDLVAEPLRFWRVRDYLIIYRSDKKPIEIVRVLHGKRDV
jgi:plasmid stabilization system protein ParE